MTGGRETVLRRVREALAAAPAPPAVPRDYRRGGELGRDALIDLLVERLEETGARVVRADAPAAVIADELRRLAVASVVVDPALPQALRPAGVEVREDHGLPASALDELGGAVTTCLGVCAETATIAFDGGPGQGRRAITLVPDVHVCVVETEQVVETVPELVARLEPSARAGRALVLVSGPSATSDIEFQRVEGVHGPRTLVVVLVDKQP